jgi:hypothetical protein
MPLLPPSPAISCAVQQLEHQKRVIQGLPLEQLEQWEAARHAAATTIQARWRGTRTRQRLARAIPVSTGLCDVCRAPQLGPGGCTPSWWLRCGLAAGDCRRRSEAHRVLLAEPARP